LVLVSLSFLFKFPELIIGGIIAHVLHLIGLHLINSIRYHVWSPGSVTAVVTLPFLILIIGLYYKNNTINWKKTLIGIFISSIVLFGNLRFLHEISPTLTIWLENIYKQ
jgi:hypothetical protein